jgi:hypothetical protein
LIAVTPGIIVGWTATIGGGIGMADGEWYYCLDHHMVEPYDACKSESRLGPYRTPAEAANALATVAQRNDDWENDPRFNDDLDDDDRRDEKDSSGPFH